MSVCTTASREWDEPLAATAAEARTWLLIEQPGPWGAKALTASHLDPAVGRELERLAEGGGVRVGLIRRPGRHADSRTGEPRRVLAAHTVPGRSWVRSAVVDDPAQLLAADFAALGRGDGTAFGEEYHGAPVALVCTNGKRDRCCALRGRPLAVELAAMGGCQVWETSHIGGHRFSPTMLVLPYGYAYGRLSPHTAKDVLEATRQGRMVVEWCRGRSTWERPGQAAELAVRRLTGEEPAEALAVEPLAVELPTAQPLRQAVSTKPSGNADEEGERLLVRHTDGRRWTVAVRPLPQDPARPESCGGAPVRPMRMAATVLGGA